MFTPDQWRNLSFARFSIAGLASIGSIFTLGEWPMPRGWEEYAFSGSKTPFTIFGVAWAVGMCIYALHGMLWILYKSNDWALMNKPEIMFQTAVAKSAFILGLTIAFAVMMFPIMRDVSAGLWFYLAWVSLMMFAIIGVLREVAFDVCQFYERRANRAVNATSEHGPSATPSGVTLG